MLGVHGIPSWEPIVALEGSEVFFEEKLDDRGKFYYRKLITNKKYTLNIEGRDPVFTLKFTSKWLHEDDFTEEWICNPKRRLHSNIAIVVLDNGVIQRLKGVYNRKIRGWTEF